MFWKYLPGALGAALVVAGLALIDWRLGLIALGVVGLVIDRRIT